MLADQFKNLMIGLFVTVAATIIIFILMFLHPRIGDEGKILHVRFTDVDKVTPGTRVTYAGKPVGEVLTIEEVEEGRGGRTDSTGRVYLYQLKLRVDTGVDVYNTDEITLRTSGLLGEKNVEITPYAPKKDEKLEIINDKILYAGETGSVEDTLKEFKQVADRVEASLDLVSDLLTRVKKEKIVENVSKTIKHIESITRAIDKPQELSEIIANMHKLSENVLKSWGSVDETIHNIGDVAKNANEITAKVAAGDGTLGKLLTKDDLYLRTNSIMSKLETTLDDVNHYGLMFHSDKGWQRLRARRMNLLEKLRTPQEFRNYFNDEVDQISTSISRVYTILSDVEVDPYCADMMQDPNFSKVFSELLRRVTMLEEELTMYNTQIQEVKVHETELGNPPLMGQDCQM